MIDAATIKSAAAGRWPEIFSAVGGVDEALFDGRHHPCPKCGGTDRCRFVDPDAGAVYCNQCFSEKNGDGLAAVAWMRGCGFVEAVRLVADYLGLDGATSQNGHAKNGVNGRLKANLAKANLAANLGKVKLVESANGDALLTLFGRAKPPITPHGIRRCNGRLASWHGQSVVRFDAHNGLRDSEPSAVVLLKTSGQPFPATEKLSERKSHTLAGSSNGWLFSAAPEAVEAAATILCVEGVPDLLAVASVGVPDGVVAAASTAGAKARGKLPRPWANGKKCIIFGDADADGEEGAKRDAQACAKAGAADVRIVQLPYQVTGSHGKDVRDFLNDGHSVAELLALADAAEPVAATVEGKGSDDDDDPGIVKSLADVICEQEHFGQDVAGRLYCYRGGVFEPSGEKVIRRRVKSSLTLWGETKRWSTRLASEVVEFIRTDATELPDRPRVDLVNVENGMLRVADGVLLPHDPKYLSTVQLPVAFDPAATCPHIDRFVETSFPTDSHELAYEVPGILMVPYTALQKAVLLLGEGSNGKSVWLSLLIRFLGKRNVATIALHRLEADKFAVARLVGKLANVCADLPSEHLSGTSVFKALVGGDTMAGECKFKDSFEIEPFARLVFSANHPPRSADASHAFFRRWKVVPFDRTFSGDSEIPRDVLDARLQDPAELSGLLNKALAGLRRVLAQRAFTETESCRAAWSDFHATTDPLAVWLDRFTIDDPDAVVPKQVLRIAYNAAVEREGRPVMTAAAFGRAIYKLRPQIEEKQRTVGGRLQWCYVGLGMVHNGERGESGESEDSQASRGSRGSLLYSSRTRERKNMVLCEDSGVKNIRANPVNLVKLVGPDTCPHHDVAESKTFDGFFNRTCRDCGANLPCRRAES